MPRQSGRSAPPRRPIAPNRPAATGPTPPQQRPASTAAHPPATQQAPPAQASQGPGLLGQMASTAAGVAVGSSIGHAVGGWFSGGSSAEAAPAQDNTLQSSQTNQYQQQPTACANEIGSFRQCMDQNRGDLTICGWYMEQLKACQQAASQY